MRLSMGLCWGKVWIVSFGSGQIGPHAPYEEQGLFLLTNKSALAMPLFKHRNTSWQRDCLYGLTYYWMAVLKFQGLLGVENTFNMNIDSVQAKLIYSVYKNVKDCFTWAKYDFPLYAHGLKYLLIKCMAYIWCYIRRFMGISSQGRVGANATVWDSQIL